jgi:iron complex outermembrane receptor protein
LRVNTFNFVASVPVEVNGVEAQVSFAATNRWDIGASASYAKSKIQDGVIPCNDYFPRDGIPDSGSGVPTLAQIGATGDNLATCVVDYRASFSPLWSAAIQSEFRLPVSATLDTYIRGLASVYGDSQSDPTNAVDDVDSYALLNLYLGLRDRSGAWEVALYGKNLTDTERVLRRDSSPATVNYNVGATSVTGVSAYRRISSSEPREFGVNVRYAFGSR